MILATALLLGTAFLLVAAVVISASQTGKVEPMPNEAADQPTSPESAFYYCINLDNLNTSRGLILGGVAV
jgi:hypothetical protein